MIRQSGLFLCVALMLLDAGLGRVQGGQKPAKDLSAEPLPPGALARFGTACLRHLEAVQGLAFTPDGSLASLGADNVFFLWDSASGKEIRRFTLPGMPVSPAEMMPVFVGGLGRVVYYGQVTGGGNSTFTPDGKYLAGSDGRHLFLWDTAKGKEVRRVEFKNQVNRIVSLSPDGKFLACTDLEDEQRDNLVHLYETGTGREVCVLRSPRARDLLRLVFSPDNAFLAGIEGNNVLRLWDLASGKRVRLYEGHNSPIYDVVFAPGGKRLATLGQDMIRFWEVDSEEELGKIPAGDSPFTCMAFAPDGATLASGCLPDNSIKLWSVARGKEIHRFTGHASPVPVLAFSRDGNTLASGSMLGDIRLWDLVKGKERTPRPATRLVPLHFTAGGLLAALDSASGNIHHLNPGGGKKVRVLAGTGDKYGLVAVAPDGKTLALAGPEGGDIHLWDAEKKQRLRKLDGPAEGVLMMVFSHDGRMLASVAADMTLRLWWLKSGKEFQRIVLRQPLVIDQVEIPVANFMARGNQPQGFNLCRGVIFSPDDRLLAGVGQDNMLYLWETASGKERCRFRINQNGVTCLAFSPDGRHLASGSSDEAVRLWDTGRGKLLRGFLGHRGDIRALAFAPDGKVLASAGQDAVIRFWDIDQGKEIRRFTGHRGPIFTLRFSPDGSQLVSGSRDSTILVWDVNAPLSEPVRPLPSLAARLEDGWARLGGQEAIAAHEAITRLCDLPPFVDFLKKRLPPAAPAGNQRIVALIAELDSPRFLSRQKATLALEKLGGQAIPALLKAVAAQPSAERSKRLKAILARLDRPASSPDNLRALRAVEVLERMGSPEARRLLQWWASGAPEAFLTREARGALARLEQRGP